MFKAKSLIFVPMAFLVSCSNTENIIEDKKSVLLPAADLSLSVENSVQSAYVGAPIKEILLKKTGSRAGKATFKLVNSNCKGFFILEGEKVTIASDVPNKDGSCRAEVSAHVGVRRSQTVPVVIKLLEYKGPSLSATNAAQVAPARGVIAPIELTGVDGREGSLIYDIKETSCPGLLELNGNKVVSKPRFDLSGKECEAQVTVKSSAWNASSTPLIVKIKMASANLPEVTTAVEEAESQIFPDSVAKVIPLQTVPADFGDVKFSVKETNCPGIFTIKGKEVIISAPADFTAKLCFATVTGKNASGETNPISLKVRVVNNNKDFLSYCRDGAATESIRETVSVMRKHFAYGSGQSELSCEKTKEKFANIKTLDLTERTLGSLKPLSQFNNIKTLKLSGVVSKNGHGNKLEDISDLASLTSLESLDLSRNNIKSVSALNGLERLRVLNLNENKISSVEDLNGLTLLEELSIASQNGVSDLSPLKTLTKLETLRISDNPKITDLLPLAELKSLKKLQFEKCGVSDISALKNFQSLKLLDASQNAVADLSPLSSLNSLKFVYLANNQIKDISPLANLVTIEHLDLSANGIASDNLKYLSGLGVLTSVNLSKNTLSTIDVFAKLESVENLMLAENALTDLSPLINLVRLTGLNLEKNPALTRENCPSNSLSIGLNRECGFFFK